jgi:asparagine synthase (glutamine-hydrolysing)
LGGLAAIVDFNAAPDPALGERLGQAVALRGADQQGSFAEGPVLLAQHRNMVIPGGRKQPIVSDRYALIFDGRLYDHVDLARSTPGGHHGGARAPGDAEVLLQAWEAWGPACLTRLDGAWAIAVWDRREQALYLARDPLGLRPLYYHSAAGRCAVASLPDRLTLLPWVSRELQREHLCEYLAFRYVHAPRTLLRDVQALPPGCLLRFDARGTRLEQHSRLRYAAAGADTPGSDEGVQELDRLVRRAVTRRARTGGAVGVLLSGGMDSTVLALDAKQAGIDLRAYHLHFPESGVDEAAFAGRVARLHELPLEQVQLDAASFDGALERCTRAMGGPLPDPAAVGQYVLLRAARRDVRVVLSGTGGDELLAGGHLSALALVMKQVGVLDRATARLRCRVEDGLRGAGLSDLALRPMRYGLQRLAGGTEVFDHEGRKALLGLDQARPRLRHEALLPLYTGIETDPINTLLAIFQRGWLAEDILARGDRLAQACGIEHRYPLLDQAVVSWINGIPGAWKLRTRWGLPKPKWPLRRMLEGQVPRSIYDRPKRSWPAPLNRWLRHEGAPFLRARSERLLDAPWGLWQPDPVRAMVQAHLEGERYHGGALWVLILLDSWLQQLHDLG